MQHEILLALLSKMIDERLQDLPQMHSMRGPRGPKGQDGQAFDFSEHADTIRAWAKEFALKFEDLTIEQLRSLRGSDGRDGATGRDGHSFIFDEHRDSIEELLRAQIAEASDSLKLKFEDLSAEEIGALRGLRGRDGQDGKGFSFEESRDAISGLVRCRVEEIADDLKLKFSDLNDDDIGKLRGPRGRDGHDGRDFNFDDHLEYFDGLKLRFSDLTAEERQALTLQFSNLTEEEKASLKLRFSDLTDEDRVQLKGSRGARGQKGQPGRSSEWMSGSGPPLSAGTIGDMYLDVKTGEVYKWED